MSKDSGALSALAPRARALSLLCLCLCAAVCGGGQETSADPEVSARVERAIAAHEGTTWRVAFSPDRQFLASCAPDKTVKLWRVEDGSLARTLTHPEGVTNIAFSPDGRRLATGGEDREIRLWSLKALTR